MKKLLRRLKFRILRILKRGQNLSVLTRKQMRKIKRANATPNRNYVRNFQNNAKKRQFYYIVFAIFFITFPQIFVACTNVSLPLSELFQESTVLEIDFRMHEVMNTTWQVLGGLIGTSFTVVVFLIQVAHDDNRYGKKVFDIFAAKSNVIPLIIFALLSLISMGINTFMIGNPANDQLKINSITEWNFILAILNVFALMYLYINTFRLIQPRFWENAIQEVIQSDIYKTVDISKEIEAQLSISVLQQFCSETGIDLYFLPIRTKTDYQSITAKVPNGQLWEIRDINLALIDKANYLCKTSSNDNCLQLNLRPNWLISSRHPIIAMVPSNADLQTIQNLMQFAFKYTKNIDREGETVSTPLSLGKDYILQAIQANQPKNIEIVFSYYLNALDMALQIRDDYNLHNTSSITEFDNLLTGNLPVSTVIRIQLSELMIPFLRCGDRNIVVTLLRAIDGAMRIAVEHSDSEVFSKFIDLFIALYIANHNSQVDLSIRELIFDRTLHRVKEFYQIYVKPNNHLNEAADLEIQRYGVYTSIILLFFNKLIKQAIGFNNSEHYKAYTTVILTIPENDETLRYQTPEYRNNDPIFKMNSELRSQRQLIFLGLGGYLIHLYNDDRITSNQFLEYMQPIHKVFADFADIYRTYIQAVSMDAGLIYGWDDWEMDERPDDYGEVSVGWITNQEWIFECFIYLVLTAFTPTTERVDVDTYVRSLLEKYQNLKKLEPNPRILDLLEDKLGADVYNTGLEALRSVLTELVNQQRIKEELRIVNQELDNQKTTEFCNTVIRNWRDWGIIRNIAKYSGSYIESAIPSYQTFEPNLSLQLHIAKGFFVPQSHVIYVNRNVDVGRRLAQKEDAQLLKIMSSKLDPISTTFSALENCLDNILQRFRDLEETAVLFYTGPQIDLNFRRSHSFTPSRRIKNELSDLPGLTGLYKDMPTFRLSGLDDDTILIMSVARFGRLTQFLRSETENNPLTISIDVRSEEEAIDYIESHPEVLRKFKNKESAIRKLRQYVSVTLSENLQFVGIDPGSRQIVKVELPKEDDPLAQATTNQVEPSTTNVLNQVSVHAPPARISRRKRRIFVRNLLKIILSSLIRR